MRRSLAVLPLLALAVPSLGLPGKPLADITPNDLRQAVEPNAVRATLPQPGRWWPLMPEFNVGLGADAKSERFYIVQSFERPADPARQAVQTVVMLHTDPAAAAADFTATCKQDKRVCAEVTGPSVGEGSCWLLRPAAGKDSPLALTVRYRLGPCTGRVTWLSAGTPGKPSQVARCAEAILGRLRQVLDGRLAAEPLSAEMAEFAVAPRDLRDLGGLLGEAEVPAESWAIVDTMGAPMRQRDFLRKNGAGTLGFWRYGAIRKPGQVVEVTLFPFRDAAAAHRWVKATIDEAAAKKLVRPKLGRTGSVAVFTHRTGTPDAYEIQFARGRCAVSVYGFAPFGVTSPALEGVVRAMAERWYALMPGE